MKMCKMGFCGFLGWERGFFYFFVKSADFFLHGRDFKSICACFWENCGGKMEVSNF